MALPKGYRTDIEYFSATLEFLKEFQWIFRWANTDILIAGVFDQIPKDWCDFFTGILVGDLHKLAKAEIIENAPESLNNFILKVNNLKSPLSTRKCNPIEIVNKKGLSKKKQHEISLLAPIIQENCEKTQCDVILDIGSGLGYLPELLSEQYDYKVIGLESDLVKVKSAELNKSKKSKCKNSITYHELFVCEDSDRKICEILQNQPFCITGLHACADLSVTILKLFAKIKLAKSLIIMPCCYHRMQWQDELHLKNFPLSASLKDLFTTERANEFLQVPFLRLSCQGTLNFTKMSAEQHMEHAHQLLLRAILQQVAAEAGQHVRRQKRKNTPFSKFLTFKPLSFEIYLTNLKSTHAFEPSSDYMASTEFERKMHEKWVHHAAPTSPSLFLVQALTALQVAIQSLCENMILYDRIVYLNEIVKAEGVECAVEKVTDEGISPRCHALLATRRQPLE